MCSFRNDLTRYTSFIGIPNTGKRDSFYSLRLPLICEVWSYGKVSGLLLDHVINTLSAAKSHLYNKDLVNDLKEMSKVKSARDMNKFVVFEVESEVKHKM